MWGNHCVVLWMVCHMLIILQVSSNTSGARYPWFVGQSFLVARTHVATCHTEKINQSTLALSTTSLRKWLCENVRRQVRAVCVVAPFVSVRAPASAWEAAIQHLKLFSTISFLLAKASDLVCVVQLLKTLTETNRAVKQMRRSLFSPAHRPRMVGSPASLGCAGGDTGGGSL